MEQRFVRGRPSGPPGARLRRGGEEPPAAGPRRRGPGLADYLSCQGVNVSIVLFDSVRYGTDQCPHAVIRYVVKEHTQPMDVTAVAFAMCEIAFFRVVGALGGSRHLPGKLSESLGSAAALPAADRKSCDFMIDSNVLSTESAKQWLRECMAGTQREMVHA